jgi:hypothetical protein
MRGEGLAVLVVALSLGTAARAEEPPPPVTVPTLEIYGFAMTDFGYNFGTIDPNWFDVVRPTKLPATPGEFGEDGRIFAGVRQTRFGVKGYMPSPLGEMKTIFEFELFGTGVDAGQTTFRLRHAFGELGEFGAGQTWSPFMDIDVFPNSIEYWGPNGMPFFRNVQIRWMPYNKNNSRFTIAIERPGATADLTTYTERVELEDVTPRFPAPDVSAEGRLGGDWGYVELAGIVRYLRWDDVGRDAFDLSGDTVGWGLSLSSNLSLGGKNKLKLLAVYGEGIGNYMNDAGDDVAIKRNPGNARRPVEGVALPVLGLVGFVDLYWGKYMSTTAGYSLVRIDNTDGQADTALRLGHYALANVLFHPTEQFHLGPELQWGSRYNFRGGYSYDDVRVQFSLKYDFSVTLATDEKPASK